MGAASRDRSVRLAIVDFMMPGGDGMTVIRALVEGGRELPCILYSAYVDSLADNWAVGADLRIVSKAEPIERLVSAVQQLTGGGGER